MTESLRIRIYQSFLNISFSEWFRGTKAENFLITAFKGWKFGPRAACFVACILRQYTLMRSMFALRPFLWKYGTRSLRMEKIEVVLIFYSY